MDGHNDHFTQQLREDKDSLPGRCTVYSRDTVGESYGSHLEMIDGIEGEREREIDDGSYHA
jgi:hypothetical protein